MLFDTEQITGYRYLCVSGHRTDHRTHCWIQWTNLTVSYMDRILTMSDLDWFHIVSLYVLLTAFQLTVIIILIVK